MSNINTFSSREAINQQACLWVSRIDRGLTDPEKTEMNLWVKHSESHQQSLFEMAALWDDLSVLNELSDLFPLTREEQSHRQLDNLSKYRALAASVLVIGITLATWFTSGIQLTASDNIIELVRSTETQIGQQKSLTLPDGSVIHLNTNSLVNIDFTSEQRNLTLVRGEALFEVAHDEGRPFIVKAGNNSVTAIGTAFNVQMMEHGELELLVTEGKVLLAKANESTNTTSTAQTSKHPLEGKGLLIQSGEKVLFTDDITLPKARLSTDQVERVLAWQQGMLVFQGEALEEALREVSRYSDVNFEIIDSSVKQQRVAGYFKAGDIDGLLFTLQQNFNIQSQRTGNNNIVLSAERKIIN